MNDRCKKASMATCAAAGVAVAGGAVMLLWNNVLHPVLKVNKMNYCQALGTLALSRLLFGSHGGGHRGRWAKSCCSDAAACSREDSAKTQE